jgi:hypothetical protein
MGVDDWITGVELVGVGVVVGVIGVELDVVGRGEDVVIRVEEVEGLGVKEEVEAIEVELVDIVNCLLNTSFLGCLKPCLGLNHAQQQQRLDWSCLGGECRSVAVSCLRKSVGRAVGGLLLRAQWWADWRCLAAGCPGAV